MGDFTSFNPGLIGDVKQQNIGDVSYLYWHQTTVGREPPNQYHSYNCFIFHQTLGKWVLTRTRMMAS